MAAAAPLPPADLPSLGDFQIQGRALLLRYHGASRFGALRFHLGTDAGGQGSASERVFATGLRMIGPQPSQNWIELDRLSLSVTAPDTQAFLRRLLAIVPPGGHVMVEYDSPEHAATARRLVRRWPPVATPLGRTLFAAGAVATFKDWYYAEGGSEGPRKLQAFRPLDAAHNRDSARRALDALGSFRSHVPSDERQAYDALVREVQARAEGT